MHLTTDGHSGVSVQNDKYVVIRGLGDRYVTANLNGSAMSSTSSERSTLMG